MSARLSKLERAEIYAKFNGRCAYCGEPLGGHWHVDHLEPVVRDSVWVRGRGFVPTGKLQRPHNDRPDNLLPACPPCNIDKHALALEEWRGKLQRQCQVLARHSTGYRHARRFGLIIETGAPVVFHFERAAAGGAA